MIKNIIAKKTKNKTQNLLEHSKEVFENCLKNIYLINKNILKNFLNIEEQQYLEQNFKKILFFISFFHDIGKMDVNFQKFIKKDEENDLNNYLEHHIISYYIFKLLNINNSIINDDIKDVIKYCILYHHSFNPLNKNSVNFLNNKIDKKLLKNTLEKILEENNETLLDYLSKVNNEYYSYFQEKLNIELKTIPKNFNDFCLFPSYKDIEVFDNQSIKYNALKTTIKLFFNTIDRKTSFSFEFDKSIDFENKNFEKDTCFYLDNDEKFPLNNERTKAQNKVIEEILKNYNNNNISVLNGAAGVGKTRIFLKIFKELRQGNKQMFIVVPRNTIAESLYEEFKQQYYFNDSVSIEILNNEREDVFFKNNESEVSNVSNPYNSNIVIITIDRLTKLLNDNHLIYNFERLLNSFIVFDEFHEIFYLDSLCIYFKEVIETFSFFNNSKVLLTSGTINPFFVKNFLEIEEKNIFKLDSFNNQLIHVIFSNLDETNKEIVNNNTINLIPNKNIKYLKDYKEKIKFQIEKGLTNFIDIQEKIINSQRNTIFYLQEISKIKENLTNNIINIHSYFNKEDKKNILEHLLKKCKKITHKFKIYSAPIIQASVNITCKYMFTNYSTPDNLLQRLGRLNRFAELENEGCSYFFINYEQEKNIKNIKDDTLKQQEKINNLFINFLLKKFYEKNNEKYYSQKNKDESQFIDFIININQFRKLYNEFFDEEDIKKEFEKLLKYKFDKISNMTLKEVLPYDYSFIEDQKNNEMCLTYRGKSGIKILVNKTSIDISNISNISNEKSSNLTYIFLDNNKTNDIIDKIKNVEPSVLKALKKDNKFFKEYEMTKYNNISINEKLRIITTKKGYAVPFNCLKDTYAYISINNIILGLVEEKKFENKENKKCKKKN